MSKYSCDSIEGIYLSLMSIVNLCAREFIGRYKSVLLLWSRFLVSVCYAVLSVLWHCRRRLGGAGLLDLLCVVFSSVLVAFHCGVPGWVWCLVISIPDLVFFTLNDKLFV